MTSDFADTKIANNTWQGCQLADRTFWVEGYNEESLNKLRELLDKEAGNA